MKRIKTLFALLLALTLLLGLAPVAFADATVNAPTPPEHSTVGEVTVDGETANFTWEAEKNYRMDDPKVSIEPAKNGEVAEYDPQTQTVTLSNLQGAETYTVTLTATLKETVAINYDGGVNDGSVSDMPNDVMDLVEGESHTITDTIPVRDGYVFVGWKYDDKIYKAGDTLNVPASQVDLIAQWAVALTITYEPGTTSTVSGMPNPVEVTVGAGNEFTTAAAPTSSGYSFQGWRASWNNKLYGAGKKVTVTALPEEKLTLTAEWEKQITTAIPGKPVEGGDSGGGSSSQSYYYIYADCSSGGSISPSGYTRVSKNGSLTVSFAPKSGYSILAVYVDGVKTGTVGGQYTFSNVTADHKIYVQFEKTSEGYDDVPKTGDEAPLAAALGLSALSLAGLACLLVSKRRAMQR